VKASPLFGIAVFLCIPFFHTATAADSTFVLKATSLSPYFPSFLGNGYLSLSTSLLGTTPGQSYITGLYDHGEGDVPRIAELPAWNEIDIFDGCHWLNETPVDSIHLSSFHQELNMYDAVLSTTYVWRCDDHSLNVHVKTFISREKRNCAVIRLILQPRFSGRLKISFPLQARVRPKRIPLSRLDSVYYGPPGGWPVVWYPGYLIPMNWGVNANRKRANLWMISKSDGKGMLLAQAITVTWPAGLPGFSVDSMHTDSGVNIIASFDAVARRKYAFFKYTAAFTGDEERSLRLEAVRLSTDAEALGYRRLLREHALAWHKLWETDIEVTGLPDLQRVIHSMMFYLQCSLRKETALGIPPMGLSTAGYYGHIFWDSDTWMFPALLMLHPELARSMVMFRYRTLDAARANAKANGYSGAMFPWEADEAGQESTPRFAHQNASFENHVVGDVALAQWQYYLATGDTAWLSRYGYKVIKETADFWVSRVTRDSMRDRYDIEKAVSVNEGLIGIANDTYTNAICRKNLMIAQMASEVLDVSANPLWHVIASNLMIPYDSLNCFHPVYENAPMTLGSAGLELCYPLGFEVDKQVLQNDLLSELKRASREGQGAMMGATLLPLAAAELGDQDLFDSLLSRSYRPFLRPPFNVLSETPRNVSVNFLTGAGGFLQQVIFGWTGLRLREKGLVRAYKPMLPKHATKLILRGISFRGKRYDVEVTRDSTAIYTR
jgi:trehalose/maltose hydrolase-like predicted phosphorylase